MSVLDRCPLWLVWLVWAGVVLMAIRAFDHQSTWF